MFCKVSLHSRDDLERAWEDRFQPTYGVLRDEVLTTFDEYRSAERSADFRPPPRIPKYLDTSEALDDLMECDPIDTEFDA